VARRPGTEERRVKKLKKPEPESRTTTHIRVTFKAYQAVKYAARRSHQSMTTIASKLLECLGG
jgi:hypothetical protein